MRRQFMKWLEAPGLNLKLAWGFQSQGSSFQGHGWVQQLGPHGGIESWPFLASTLASTFLSPASCPWYSRKQWESPSWLLVSGTVSNCLLCSYVGWGQRELDLTKGWGVSLDSMGLPSAFFPQTKCSAHPGFPLSLLLAWEGSSGLGDPNRALMVCTSSPECYIPRSFLGDNC